MFKFLLMTSYLEYLLMYENETNINHRKRKDIQATLNNIS